MTQQTQAPHSARRPTPPPNPGARTMISIIGGTLGLAMIATGTVAAARGSAVYPTTEQTYSLGSEAITGLVVSAEEMDVQIISADVSEITMDLVTSSFPPGDPNAPYARTVDGVLTIDLRRDANWLPSLTLGPRVSQDQVTIQIPQEFVPDLDLQAGVGDTVVSGDFAAVSVTGGVGAITLDGTATSLQADIGVGDLISRIDVSGGAVDVESGVGSSLIDLGTSAAPSTVTVTGGVGDVTVLLPPVTLGYRVSAESGIGGVQNGAPAPSPETGVDVTAPIAVNVEGGLGQIILGVSTR